jgi:thiazolinyl imide reductase
MPHKYRLCGILGRGSERSRALASHLNVPFFTNPKDVPKGEIDIACVVIRSTLFDGSGTRLAEELLKQGIHVLQEHPLHPSEIKVLYQTAHAHNVQYHMNSFYPHISAGACFIRYAQEARQQTLPTFVEITTSHQMLFSTLDIVGRALGGLKDFTLYSSNPHGVPHPFDVFQGIIGTVPFTCSLQSYMDSVDVDHHFLTNRIAMGGTEGVIQLTNSFGPVVWTHSTYMPNYHVDSTPQNSPLLSPERYESCPYMALPNSVVFEGTRHTDSLLHTMQHAFPYAIESALDELSHAINSKKPAYFASESYCMDLGNAWINLLRQAGSPQLKNLSKPLLPHPNPLTYAKNWITEDALST